MLGILFSHFSAFLSNCMCIYYCGSSSIKWAVKQSVCTLYIFFTVFLNFIALCAHSHFKFKISKDNAIFMVYVIFFL